MLLGGSSGVNIAGAIRLARELGPGRTIVTLLCDSGARYASKLFNPAFLREKELPVPNWLNRRCRHPAGLSVTTRLLFRDDSYRREADARVVAAAPGRHRARRRPVLSATAAASPAIAANWSSPTARRSRSSTPSTTPTDKTIVHVAGAGRAAAGVGERVVARSTGTRATSACASTPRCICFRVVLPYPVTGGSVGDGEGRLDFDIPAKRASTRREVEARLNALIADRRRGDARAGSATTSSTPIPAWSRPCR